MRLSILAQVTTSPPTPDGLKNAFIAMVIGALGFGVAACFVYPIRNKFKTWYADKRWFDVGATVLERGLAFAVGAVVGVFELFKITTLKNGDAFTWTIYGVAGALLAWAILIAYLISSAKGKEKEQITALTGQLAVTSDQRDRVLEAIASWGEAIGAKAERFRIAVNGAPPDHTHLIEALNPTVQIQLLIKSLHEHFARHLSKPETLRVGIYMRNPEDAETLVAIYSWDGKNTNCFSNKHKDIMNLNAAGGARSLLVQCFRSDNPLHLVADCDESSRQKENPFIYFSATQRNRIKSMLAYRFMLSENGKKDAMILTMDTTKNGFFVLPRKWSVKWF